MPAKKEIGTRNIVLAFSLISILLLVTIVIGHILAIIGLISGSLQVADFYLATPLSVFILLLNIWLVQQLKQFKLIGYLLGLVEMIILFIYSLMPILATKSEFLITSLLFSALSISVIYWLVKDYRTHAKSK